MSQTRSQFSDADLQQEREAIRRGLLRVSTAAVVILAVIVALALAAIVEGYRADLSVRAAREDLWNSYLAQAQAARFAGQVGQRFKSLEIIRAAAKIRQSPELRNEAIACLALTDLEDEENWQPVWTQQGVVFDANLERYAMVDLDGTIRIAQISDQREVQHLAHTGSVYTLQFSPDNRFLAGGFVHGTAELLVWNLSRTSVVLQVAGVHPKWTAASFSPAQPQIAVTYSVARRQDGGVTQTGLIRIYDLATGLEVNNLELGGVPDLIAYHPDGQILAAGLGAEVQLWDLTNRKLIKKLPHPGTVISLAWRDDGKLLATGCQSAEAFVWEVATGRFRSLPGHHAQVMYVEFNHRGDRLVSTAQDGTTRIWDPESGRPLLSTHRGYGRRFSRDDQRLGFIKPGQGSGVWRLAPEREYRTFASARGEAGRIWSLNISPDGKLLATMNGRGLQLWDMITGAELDFQPMNARSAIFLDEGRTLMTSGAGGIRLWPIEPEGQPASKSRLGPPVRLGLPADIYLEYCSVAADGHTLVVDAGYDEALLLDLKDDSRRLPFKGLQSLASVAISPDARWIAAGTWHGSQGVWIWNAKTGELIKQLHGLRSADVAFSPDGRWLVTGTADDYRFWKAGTWEATDQDRNARDTTGELTGPMAFTRDGKMMALAPTQRSVQLIHPETRQEIATLTSPDPRIAFAFAFSADGSRLAVGAGGIVQVWNLKRIARQLAAIGLSWDGPAFGEAVEALDKPGLGGPSSGLNRTLAAVPELRKFGLPGSRGFTALALAGVALAIPLAWFVLQRHRKLIEGYERIDDLVAERNGELEVARIEILHGQKMKALGTLAAGIAHDFNNLLSVIRMSNKLIGREARENAEIQENVHAIEQAVEQGKTVVRSMLGYSREEPGEHEPYSVTEVVEDAVALLTRQFLTGITLTLELDPTAPEAHGSRGRLEQVLLNLVVNAAEAMDGCENLLIAVRPADLEGVFVLRPRSAEQYVELVVADSGPGIDPEILDRIFEPFFTTKKAGATRGTGLGLSMVYSIAQQDGLGIRLESVVGKGTTFRVIIPAHIDRQITGREEKLP
jgi:signal transduction histidine kinase